MQKNLKMIMRSREPSPPRGYRFNVKQNFTSDQKQMFVELLRRRNVIGKITLEYVENDGLWETHSHLNDDQRGSGLGVLLYQKAIRTILERRQRVASSRSPSPDARMVWSSNRLNSMFEIRRLDDRYHVLGYK